MDEDEEEGPDASSPFLAPESQAGIMPMPSTISQVLFPASLHGKKPVDDGEGDALRSQVAALEIQVSALEREREEERVEAELAKLRVVEAKEELEVEVLDMRAKVEAAEDQVERKLRGWKLERSARDAGVAWSAVVHALEVDRDMVCADRQMLKVLMCGLDALAIRC